MYSLGFSNYFLECLANKVLWKLSSVLGSVTIVTWLNGIDLEILCGESFRGSVCSLCLFCCLQGNHKGPVRRWDFDNEDDYSTYQSAREAMPKQVVLSDSGGREGKGVAWRKEDAANYAIATNWPIVSSDHPCHFFLLFALMVSLVSRKWLAIAW